MSRRRSYKSEEGLYKAIHRMKRKVKAEEAERFFFPFFINFGAPFFLPYFLPVPFSLFLLLLSLFPTFLPLNVIAFAVIPYSSCGGDGDGVGSGSGGRGGDLGLLISKQVFSSI